MKYFFEIRAAEKIIRNGETQSGDDIVWEKRRTKKAAFSLGDKLLKRPDIYSVWITHWIEDEAAGWKYIGLEDPIEQYSKYEYDLKWSTANL